MQLLSPSSTYTVIPTCISSINYSIESPRKKKKNQTYVQAVLILDLKVQGREKEKKKKKLMYS